MDNIAITNHFQEWIDNYADDIRLLASLLNMEGVPDELKRLAVGTLNYGLKQLDLIPDFYAPVGLIDDAMIIRIFANLGTDLIIKIPDDLTKRRLIEMTEGDAIIKEFCGDQIYRALVNYVKALPDKKVRQRDAKIVLGNEEIRKEFITDIEVELKGYVGSKIDDPDSVVKDLRSFLKLKLVG
ncbi:DUF1232 domain-containing protein [Myxococcota bacterium]|nr:DUF1232 domain-containing protein [Myxococcota bacterium]MBU1537253.1 DUF1232 domain-containing protein [Myxococcota bacterium]